MPYLEYKPGKRLYYESHGHSGPVIILLHGLASSSRIWIRQVRALRKYCQVYTFDFPGHGQSDWLQAYSLAEFTALVKFLMDELGIQQASLIAISLGCSVALTFAAHYPERVDKLILEGPVGGYHVWWNPLGLPDQLVFGFFPFAIQLSISLFGYHAVAHWINTFGVKAKRNFKILETVQEQTDFKAIRKLLWDCAIAPYTGILEHVTSPVLLIRGKNDPMPRRFVNYIRTHLGKVSYIEVPNTRHLVAMEKPHEFNGMVMHFLGLVPRNKKKGLQGSSA